MVVGEIGALTTVVGLVCQFLGASTRLTAIMSIAVMAALAILLHRSWMDRVARSSTIAVAGVLGLLGLWLLVGGPDPVTKDSGVREYHRRANDFLGRRLESRIAEAQEEVVFFGTAFHISASDSKDQVVAALTRGVRVRYLIVDPLGTNFEQLARDFGVSSRELGVQCQSSMESLALLAEEWETLRKSVRNPGEFEVRCFDATPRMRAYVFDGGRSESFTYVVPYINRLNSADTAGLLCQNVPGGLFEDYLASINQVWRDARPLSQVLAEASKRRQASEASASP